MVPRFQVLDLLVVVTAIAITLTMLGRIPEYEDWHWNHALLTYECPETPAEFTDPKTKSSYREAADMRAANFPTAFGDVSFASGTELFRTVHLEGFASAVEDFLSGKPWPAEVHFVEPQQPHVWSEEHYILGQEYGYRDGVHAIDRLLLRYDQTTLRRRLNRTTSYYWQFGAVVTWLGLLSVVIIVRLVRGGYLSNQRAVATDGS